MAEQNLSLETIVSTAISLPGVKVNRNSFLTECFKNEDIDINVLLEHGPVEANCSREMLHKLANKLILNRTSTSSIASFIAGLPGGLTMGVTIPADVLQFFGIALRLAQELSYLYGENDLWENGEINTERVNDQLILYCGVMFGVSGAASGVRLLSSQLAKTALKKIPQKALTKTFWYPIIKQIGKAIGIKVTKNTVANGISKVIPVIGGVVSGGITFASMLPMGNRLADALDKAHFDYTDADIQADISALETLSQEAQIPENNESASSEGGLDGVKKSLADIKSKASGFFAKARRNGETANAEKQSEPEEDVFQKIEKLAKLKELGAISTEEFEAKKTELLSRL